MKAEIRAIKESGNLDAIPDGISEKKKAIAAYLREHPEVTSKSANARRWGQTNYRVKYYNEIEVSWGAEIKSRSVLQLTSQVIKSLLIQYNCKALFYRLSSKRIFECEDKGDLSTFAGQQLLALTNRWRLLISADYFCKYSYSTIIFFGAHF